MNYVATQYITCKELKIVKIHANTSVSSLTASMPIIQVTPSNGKRIIRAFNKSLVLYITIIYKTKKDCLLHCIFVESSFFSHGLFPSYQHFESNYQKYTINLQYNHYHKMQLYNLTMRLSTSIIATMGTMNAAIAPSSELIQQLLNNCIYMNRNPITHTCTD